MSTRYVATVGNDGENRMGAVMQVLAVFFLLPVVLAIVLVLALVQAVLWLDYLIRKYKHLISWQRWPIESVDEVESED